MPFVNGIKAARQRIVARSDEDRADFLRRRGFSKAETGKIIDAVLAEEGRPPESILCRTRHKIDYAEHWIMRTSRSNRRERKA